VSELARYDFLIRRDGVEAALAFERDVVRTYRKAVLDKSRYRLKRRELIRAYVEAKRIVGAAQ